MKKTVIRLLGVICAVFFAVVLLGMKEIPAVDEIRETGWTLLTQSLGGHAGEYGAYPMVLEMLGEKQYFNPGRESEQELILAENRQNNGSGEGVDVTGSGQVIGDVYGDESAETMAQGGKTAAVRKSNAAVEKLRNTLDTSYLWNKFYIIDSTTSVKKDMFDVKKLLEKDLKLEKKKGKKPKQKK